MSHFSSLNYCSDHLFCSYLISARSLFKDFLVLLMKVNARKNFAVFLRKFYDTKVTGLFNTGRILESPVRLAITHRFTRRKSVYVVQLNNLAMCVQSTGNRLLLE